MVEAGPAEAVTLTVYPDNLAMVTETRRVKVPAGRSTVAFTGVSDRIIPQSLVLREFSGVSLQRNFDYDLLSKGMLFEAAVGDTMRLTRIDRGSGRTVTQEAAVVSADSNSGVVVKTEDGYEGLYCSGLAVRESFDVIPPGLVAEPRMSIEVEAETAGEQEVTISYLTSGMGWEADYTLSVEGENSADLLGWLSLRNDTNMRVEDADLSVVAGQLQRFWDTREVEARSPYLSAVCWPVGSTKRGIAYQPNITCPDGTRVGDISQCPALYASVAALSADFEDEIIVTGARMAEGMPPPPPPPPQLAEREDFADYKLYRIPRLVTVAAHQTKQLAFVAKDGVEVETLLYLDLDSVPYLDNDRPQPLTVRYDIDNASDGKLGEPLPQGNVRVFAPSITMGEVYVGEDAIEDLPVDLPVEVAAGRSANAFFSARPKRQRERQMSAEVVLSNASDEAVDVLMDSRSFSKVRVNGARRDRDEEIPTFRVTVPANETKTLQMVFPYN